MGQAGGAPAVEERVGYVLKQAAAAVRAAMDAVLRPLDLTVPQYACLELLGRTPGLSNADLARGAFVTRQSMNGVLRGLQDRGLVTRPAVATRGRALATQLTDEGRSRLQDAAAAVLAVEERMLAALPPERRTTLLRDLTSCAAALETRASTPDP